MSNTEEDKNDAPDDPLRQAINDIEQDDVEYTDETYLNMAKSFIEIDENQLAIKTLKKAYKRNNENYDIVYNLAFIYFLETAYEKAVKYFDIALKLNAQSRDCYYYKGISLLRLADYDDASKCFQHILSANPDDHYAIYQLGLVYHAQGDTETAIILLKQALALGNPDAQEWLGGSA